MPAGELKLDSDVRELVLARAQRILAHPDGDFEVSDVQPVVKAYTDELNIVTVEVVTGVCEEAQSSGKARHRLLAWVVGDILGKRLDGDKTVAEVVGKRLERQAGRVRAAIAAVTDSAETDRAKARAAAALAQDETQLAAALESINTNERVRIGKLNQEAYINLHEYTVTAVAAAETTVGPAKLAIGAEEPEPEPVPLEDADGEYSRQQQEAHPHMQRWRREGGAVPPMIARCLGEEGCRLLARKLTHNRDATGDEILTIFIPGLVRSLLERSAREARWHADELQAVRAECASDVARAQSRVEEVQEFEAQAWKESEDMQERVAAANAREAVLREIVERNLLK